MYRADPQKSNPILTYARRGFCKSVNPRHVNNRGVQFLGVLDCALGNRQFFSEFFYGVIGFDFNSRNRMIG